MFNSEQYSRDESTVPLLSILSHGTTVYRRKISKKSN